MFHKLLANFLAFIMFFSMPVFVKAEELQAAVKKDIHIKNHIEINSKNVFLKSKLRKQYKSFQCTLTSNYPGTLDIINATIINDTDGTLAYQQEEESMGTSLGILWSICFPLGLFTLGIGWGVGLIGTPIVMIEDHISNNRLKKDTIGVDNQVPLVTLNQGDNIKFNTLIPINQNPQIKFNFRDLHSNNIYSMTTN